MATFSGGTSPAALAALAPSINNLAAARNARSQSISGLMNTIGAGFERKKKQKQIKEKNEIAMGIATGLLNDPSFKKSVPGITDPASLIKLTSADEVIQFGREQQKINLVTKEAKARIGLIQTQVNEFERKEEERETEKESSKAFQVLYPKTINLKPGADTKDIFKDPSFQNLTPEHAKIVFDNVSSQTGLSSQVLMAELEKAKMELGATEKSIESGELASEIIAGVEAGMIKSVDDISIDRLSEMTPDAQTEVFSALKRKNPTAPTPSPILNPNNPEEILGYAIDTGRGIQILQSAKSGNELSPGVTQNIAALKERTRLDPSDPNYITQEQFEKARGESLRTASLIPDQSGLDRDPAASSDGPDADVPISDLNSELSIGIAQRLSGLTNIISEKGEINMQELDKALAMIKSSAGLDDRNVSEIMRMLNETADDRRAAADQRERSRNMDRSMIDIEMGPERVAEREEILRRVSRGPSFPGAIGF